jgi:hypothetical protein
MSQLSLFRGKPITTYTTKLSGGVDCIDDQPHRDGDYELEDQVVLVVVATVEKIGFEAGKVLDVNEVRTFKATAAYEVTDADQAAALLEQLRAETSASLDERLGRLPVNASENAAGAEFVGDGTPEGNSEAIKGAFDKAFA